MKSIIAVMLLCILSLADAGSQSFKPDLFCFEDAFLLSPDYTFDAQVKLLKDIGFDGMEMEGLNDADTKLGILKHYGIKLYMVYVQIDLEKPQPYDPALNDFIKKIRDSGATLWLHIHSEKYGPSDPAGDEKCVEIVRSLADYAASYGVRIALYPHSRFWLEKVGDSVRLTRKIDRQNVGAVFNLCHFLKTDTREELEKKLTDAIPYLAAVSINGADDGNTSEMDWVRLIQPLGSGTFDIKNILRILKKSNFKGPVGLQCYDIKGNPSDFLKKSMMAWQTCLREL